MRPTRLGVRAGLFHALLLGAWFATPYVNLFFLLLAFASVLGVLSVVWAFRNLQGIGGGLADVAPMPAGSSRAVRVTLRCRRRMRHDLAIELRIAGRTTAIAQHRSLPPGHDHTVECLLPALPRGLHAIEELRVSSEFPFGMVATHRRIAAARVLFVYPAPADLASYRDRNGIAGLGGLCGRDLMEVGPSGLREYRQGDELRDVHWKASARRADLIVKEFEGDAAQGVEVLLDLRADGAVLEESLSLVAALADRCREDKKLLTLHSQDHHGTYGEGHGAFDDLRAWLAAVVGLPASAPPPPMVSPSVLRLPLRGAAAMETAR